MSTFWWILVVYLSGFGLTMAFFLLDVINGTISGKGRLGDLLGVWLVKAGTMLILWPIALPALLVGSVVLLVDKIRGKGGGTP